jgi:hypothetical protein
MTIQFKSKIISVVLMALILFRTGFVFADVVPAADPVATPPADQATVPAPVDSAPVTPVDQATVPAAESSAVPSSGTVTPDPTTQTPPEPATQPTGLTGEIATTTLIDATATPAEASTTTIMTTATGTTTTMGTTTAMGTSTTAGTSSAAGTTSTEMLATATTSQYLATTSDATSTQSGAVSGSGSGSGSGYGFAPSDLSTTGSGTFSSSNASTTGPIAATAGSSVAPSSTATSSNENINIEAANNSSVKNNSTTTANTGSNQIVAAIGTSTEFMGTTTDTNASSTDLAGTSTDAMGTSTIVTGNALALSDILNYLNINVLNSQTLVAILNVLSQNHAVLDLRALLGGLNTSVDCTSCDLSTTTLAMGSGSLTASSTNVSELTNNVSVEANTGNNSISSSTDAVIATGDAYAVANVVNAVNLNLINSDYKYVVINSLGSWNGDMVLPANEFFAGYLSGLSGSGAGYVTTAAYVQNQATVQNSVETSADTGNNSSLGNGGIQSGNSYSSSNVINEVNQNYLGDSSVLLTFNIFGQWTGHAFNLPQGFTAQSTPNGFEISGFLTNISGSNGVGANVFGPLQLSLANSASILNNINVTAGTGNNSATGTNSFIRTGNAYSSANVLNLVNTNAVNSNLLKGVFNVFGDWSGNLSFGEPDLKLAVSYEQLGNGKPGSPIRFDYEITNNGDAPAHNVKLFHNIPSSYISMEFPVRSIGTLSPGETRTLSGMGTVMGGIPLGETLVQNVIIVTQDEPDANLSDNTASAQILVVRQLQTGSSSYSNPGVNSGAGGLPTFTIVKTSNATTSIQASSSVQFEVKVVNTGGYANNAALVDRVTDSAGKVLHEERWILGAVDAGEEITVGYQMDFAASTTPGGYVNSAWIESLDGQFSNSGVSSASVTVDPKPAALIPILPMAQEKIVPLYRVKNSTRTNVSTTSTSTDYKLPADSELVDYSGPDQGNANLIASIFGALKHVPWYIYLSALVLFALTLYIKQKKFAQIQK